MSAQAPTKNQGLNKPAGLTSVTLPKYRSCLNPVWLVAWEESEDERQRGWRRTPDNRDSKNFGKRNWRPNRWLDWVMHSLVFDYALCGWPCKLLTWYVNRPLFPYNEGHLSGKFSWFQSGSNLSLWWEWIWTRPQQGEDNKSGRRKKFPIWEGNLYSVETRIDIENHNDSSNTYRNIEWFNHAWVEVLPLNEIWWACMRVGMPGGSQIGNRLDENVKCGYNFGALE